MLYRNSFAIIILLAILWACNPSAKIRSSNRTIYNLKRDSITAENCLKAENYACAEYLYKKLLKSDSTTAYYYIQLAKTQIWLQKDSASKNNLEKAINAGATQNFNNIYEIALLYFQIKNYTLAKQYLKRAVELNDTCDICYNNLGIINSLLYAEQEAINNYKNAIKLNSSQPAYYMNLGIEYQNQNRFDSAIYYLTESQKLNELHPQLYLNLGILYYETGSFEKGDLHLSDGLKNNTVSVDNLIQQVDRYIYGNNLSVADRMIDLALKCYPENSGLYEKKAKISEYQRDYDNAIFAYDKAIKIDSTNIDLYTERGLILFKEQKYKAALDDFIIVLYHEPENTNILIKRGYSYYKLKNLEAAKSDWNQALKLGDENAKEYLSLYIK